MNREIEHLKNSCDWMNKWINKSLDGIILYGSFISLLKMSKFIIDVQVY